jgi:hypothetical protein
MLLLGFILDLKQETNFLGQNFHFESWLILAGY